MSKLLEPYAPNGASWKAPAGYEPPPDEIDYPDSDGKPMGDNDLQREWIMFLIQSLRLLFLDREDVYVTGDLFWYPVEGNNKIVTAPDTMVVFGRPAAMRRNYRQWHENGIAPQVVFEVLSHCNTPSEMTRKRHFYDKYGVQEYYVYDPDEKFLEVWIRGADGHLAEQAFGESWKSPQLEVTFEMTPGEDLILRYPDGRAFQRMKDLYLEKEMERMEKEQARAEKAQAQAEKAQALAEKAQAQAEKEKLAAQLRSLGVDPEI